MPRRLESLTRIVSVALFCAACVSPLDEGRRGARVDAGFTPGLKTGAPTAPAWVSDGNVTTSTDSAPTVSWAPAGSNNAAQISGYEIAIGTSPGSADSI